MQQQHSLIRVMHEVTYPTVSGPALPLPPWYFLSAYSIRSLQMPWAKKPFVAQSQDATEPTCELHVCIHVQAESHLQHRKTYWETPQMSTGLFCCVYVCFVLWAAAIKDRQVFDLWYPPALPYNCHAKEDAISARPGKNLSIFVWEMNGWQVFFQGSGVSRGKIYFLIQRKDLEIYFFSQSELLLKLYVDIRKKANQVFLFSETL